MMGEITAASRAQNLYWHSHSAVDTLRATISLATTLFSLVVVVVDFGAECLLWYRDVRALGSASRGIRQELLPQLRQI